MKVDICPSVERDDIDVPRHVGVKEDEKTKFKEIWKNKETRPALRAQLLQRF